MKSILGQAQIFGGVKPINGITPFWLWFIENLSLTHKLRKMLLTFLKNRTLYKCFLWAVVVMIVW
jgi:hypothetical protein